MEGELLKTFLNGTFDEIASPPSYKAKTNLVPTLMLRNDV